MQALNQFQEYLVHEFVDDYNDGLMPRRDMIRRVLHIVGGAAATATMLTSLGVQAADAMTAQQPPATPAGSGSPLSVPADDPAIQAKDIQYPSGDATITAYEARPASSEREGALSLVLVCHENRGLTDHIRDVTRRLAKEGFLAVAVDLVSRDGGTAAHDPMEIPDLLSKVDPTQHVAVFRAAVESYAGDHAVDTAQLGMTGFCFGGGITWRAATLIPELKAAIPWYGPPPPAEDVPNIKAAVLGIYSSDEGDFANRGRDELEAALTEAGIEHQINVYPGTEHAFNNDTGPRYNEEQSLIAWADTITWLNEHLGIMQ